MPIIRYRQRKTNEQVLDAHDRFRERFLKLTVSRVPRVIEALFRPLCPNVK